MGFPKIGHLIIMSDTTYASLTRQQTVCGMTGLPPHFAPPRLVLGTPLPKQFAVRAATAFNLLRRGSRPSRGGSRPISPSCGSYCTIQKK